MNTTFSGAVLTGLVAAALLGSAGPALADPFYGTTSEQCFQGGGTASYGKCYGGTYDGLDTIVLQ